jgi:N-acetylglucosaminyldiphosphoundecaprenol N-acetyl-beta-D-mannosaminyltransferase
LARQLHDSVYGHHHRLVVSNYQPCKSETMHTQSEFETYPVLGVNISSFSEEEFFVSLNERLQMSDEKLPPLFVVTVNPEIAIQSIIDNTFREILQSSSINTADGVGISWAVKHLYNKSVDRITGSDSLEKICAVCAKLDQSVFFYGAGPGIADKAACILVERNPGLRVEGVYSPERPDIHFEDLPLSTQIELQRASAVFVALGAPSQEKWIYNNMHKLSRCRLIIGIGGSFDFIAGNKKRAPVLFQRCGLEWMYRLWLEPSRWRRMMRLPLFALNVMLLSSSSQAIQQAGNNGYTKIERRNNGRNGTMEEPKRAGKDPDSASAFKQPQFAGEKQTNANDSPHS